jgi:rare lipoprotein A
MSIRTLRNIQSLHKSALPYATTLLLILLSACSTPHALNTPDTPKNTQAQQPVNPSTTTDTANRSGELANNIPDSKQATLPPIPSKTSPPEAAITAVPKPPIAIQARDATALLALHGSANRPYTALGTRYLPMTANALYEATGWISWYGAAHQGQPTASGEVFDMNAFTAAHPVLPVPSYARVTNLANGAQAIVRINDRGPFKDKRVMDVSHAAAKQLGFMSKGVTKASVKLMSTQEAKDWLTAGAVQPGGAASKSSALSNSSVPVAPAKTANAQPQPAQISDVPRGYYVQLGAYKDNNAALVLAQRADLAARDKGLVSPLKPQEPLVQLIEGNTTNGKVARILAGPYANKPEADKAAAILGEALDSKLFVIQQK